MVHSSKMTFYLLTIFLLFELVFGGTKPRNVCNSFLDYFTLNPRNCWHNPDVYLSTRDIIIRHNYPYEEYDVVTEDYYILKILRMKRSNPKGVVLLESPAFTTSSGWVDKGERDSLGFMLWDAGYDVWMGNVRGTKLGRNHIFLNPNEKPFWNFSFHEIGKYDMPAQVDLIVNITGIKPGGLSIVSLSLGSTVNIVYSCIRPEHSGKWVNIFVLMAPTTVLNHLYSFAKVTSVAALDFLMELEKQFTGELLADNLLLHNFLRLCRNAPTMVLCLITDLVFMGNVNEEQPAKWFPVKYYQNPAGVSFKILLHYIQIIKAHKFQLFDYGDELNLEYYGNKIPPEYPIQDIVSPTFLISADTDIVTSPKDSDNLFTKLPTRANIYGKMLVRNFSHSAFFYGTNAAEKVYKPIIKLLNSIYDSK